MSLDVSSPGILFPGQGAQAPGMGAWLCENYPLANELFARAGDVLGYDLKQLCSDGPAEKLNETVHSQPALFVAGIAAAEVFSELHPDTASRIKATAGLSLGEYTAVCFAGGLSFEDGLRLVQQRGEAMQACADAAESGMSSVLGLSLDNLSEVCEECRQDGEVLQPANLLCPGNIAVSGHLAALGRLEPLALAAGAMKVVPLSVAGAFHTPLMQDAVAKLTAALADVEIRSTRIPVYSNVDAAPHSDPAEIRELLAKQVVNPVLWEASISRMLGDGIDGFLEVGTGRVLRGTIKRIARKTPTDGFGDQP
ncbi:ACP S-malonyltransferase [Allorhodopirellula heiligendammensis]|uniref:Malonyl CoA-acyl carrier protein transacylase n=1 Tax=Allorhodopirellula heiligendammensis TaxID=2714739 RepID=A0A5C6BYK2_9BACT|nr:ACP S-malonyltransferase [Allorhodopirellula heiligendammensis]TWU16356.1 Malonyl CoA-acyl carrier protein transacylase [Allorhodopirellula heiligendammensis]